MNDRTTTVVDGRLLVVAGGVKLWFTEDLLRRTIEKLQADLYRYQLMLDKLREAQR